MSGELAVVGPGFATSANWSFAEYLSYPAVSSSTIRAGLKGGMDSMLLSFTTTGDDEDTKAMRLGRAAHCKALTPLLFPQTFPTVGKCQATKKDGAACDYVASMAVDIDGEQVFMCGTHGKKFPEIPMTDYIRIDETSSVDGMAKKLSRVKELTGDGQAEFSVVFWLHKVKCKIRTDWNAPAHIGELKTGVDYPTLDNMQRAVTNNRYHIQGRLQQRGIEALTGILKPLVWIFQQSVPPFATGRLWMDPVTADAADAEIQMTLESWQRANKSRKYLDPYDLGIRMEGGLTDWERQKFENIKASAITFGGESVFERN